MNFIVSWQAFTVCKHSKSVGNNDRLSMIPADLIQNSHFTQISHLFTKFRHLINGCIISEKCYNFVLVKTALSLHKVINFSCHKTFICYCGGFIFILFVLYSWYNYCTISYHDPYRSKIRTPFEFLFNTFFYVLIMIKLQFLILSVASLSLSRLVHKVTHVNLASHFWDIAKQCRPWSDAASDHGLHCLLTGISIQNRIKMKKYTRHP